MPVSERNSLVVYDALKSAGVGLVSALPETWLVHLIRMGESSDALAGSPSGLPMGSRGSRWCDPMGFNDHRRRDA